jgi:hypothetical protein
MSSVNAMNRLRALAGRLTAAEHVDGQWFAACLAEFESGAPHGSTLADAFGFQLAPGERPWWVVEAYIRRDALIRAIALRWYPGCSDRAAVTALVRALARYRATGWRRDRAYKSPPAELLSTVQADMFNLLKIGAPLSPGTIRRALAHGAGVFLSQQLAEDAVQPIEVRHGT